LKKIPPTSGTSGSKRPSGAIGLTMPMPYARAVARSSGPNAGAWCTSPVPSSVVTYPASTT
jgi:hypothetical protein